MVVDTAPVFKPAKHFLYLVALSVKRPVWGIDTLQLIFDSMQSVRPFSASELNVDKGRFAVTALMSVLGRKRTLGR